MLNNEYQMIEKIKKYEKTYIYGAGYVGKLVNKRLNYYNVKTNGFCVTEKNSLEDIVKKIDEAEKEALIIIAAKRPVCIEMEKNLVRKKFEHYEIVSERLINVMERIERKGLRFQIHIVEHCNLKCRGCYHFSSLAKEEYISVDEYKRDINCLADLFQGKCEEILLLGGEPLLHPRLCEILKISREAFHTGTIKILSNGTKLLLIGDEFFDALRQYKIELWVTKYPIQFNYKKAEQRAKHLGVQIHYFNQEPVRSLGHQPLDITGQKDFKNNFYNCYRANECIDLKHGRLFPCIIPAEIKPFCDYFNIQMDHSENNSMDIYVAQDAEQLLSAMEKPIPFCKYCNREDVALFGRSPWATTNYQISEWTE